ncbi:MAG: hypothetical protein H7Y18_01440 [Clostridiaceae bacterium]|nr:hypothetical protein [Clostridiaceae bacterium]
MVNKISKVYGYNEFIIEDWTTTFLTGGFHIDIVNKSIDFWVAHDVPGLIDRLKYKWDRWQINWNLDKFEKHIECTDGNIVFINMDTESLLLQLREILLHNSGESVNAVLKYVDKVRDEGKTVVVNQLAIRNDKLELNRDIRENIIDSAIESLKYNDLNHSRKV